MTSGDTKQQLIEMLSEKNLKLSEENFQLSLQLTLRDKRISLLEEEKRLLATMAMLHPITKIFNANYVESEIARIKAVKEREKSKEREYACLAFIDMDGLKKINDNYGHAVGNIALCHLASTLTKLTRRSDVVAHLHGDEFIVMLLTKNRHEGKLLIARIKSELKNLETSLDDGTKLKFSATTGCKCVLLTENFCFKTLEREADLKMYLEKKVCWSAEK